MSKEKHNIILAHHSLIYSSSQALRDYIRSSTPHSLLYISHPLPEVQTDQKARSYSEFSNGSKIFKKQKAQYRFSVLPITLVYEIFLTMRWVFSQKGTFDLYIGIDNFNALTGLILKKMGKVKKVVYYTIDYFPERYPNTYLNSLYHWIDKICVKFADETWNVSDQMVTARKKHNHMIGPEFRRQFTVPIGIWYDHAPRKSFSRINKDKLIFIGHLVAHMGVDLIIESMPLILKKNPRVMVDIIGGGEELERLKKLSADLKLGKSVKFYGWIRDRSKVEEILSAGALGLAPFNTTILDDKVKNADPGKIKDYLLLGLPVVLTDAVRNADTLQKLKVAKVVKYDKKDLAQTVLWFLTNESRLQEYRKNALHYIKQFDYAAIFEKNLDRVLS